MFDTRTIFRYAMINGMELELADSHYSLSTPLKMSYEDYIVEVSPGLYQVRGYPDEEVRLRGVPSLDILDDLDALFHAEYTYPAYSYGYLVGSDPAAYGGQSVIADSISPPGSVTTKSGYRLAGSGGNARLYPVGGSVVWDLRIPRFSNLAALP